DAAPSGRPDAAAPGDRRHGRRTVLLCRARHSQRQPVVPHHSASAVPRRDRRGAGPRDGRRGLLACAHDGRRGGGRRARPARAHAAGGYGRQGRRGDRAAQHRLRGWTRARIPRHGERRRRGDARAAAGRVGGGGRAGGGRRGTVIFLVALAFLAAETARALELETVLIAVTAGVVVANVFRREGDELVRSLRQHSLPVYVILFGLTGAGLQVAALQEVGLWWVVLLAGLRVWGLRYGLRWAGAGRGGDVTPAIAREGWLGPLSQGGVALSLAAAARRAFPEWGVSLEALLVAMIGVHEVVGPICLRRALVRAGEVTEGLHVASK